MNTVINPQNTAIRRKHGSAPAKHNLDLFCKGDVLDFGCGHGADVEYYKSMGIDAVGYDPHHHDINPDAYFENVTITYVLNTINIVQRQECIADAIMYLKTGGRLIITVRADVERNARTKGWPKHLDGYWSNQRRGMFQADIPVHQIKWLVGKYMYAKLVEIKKTSGFRTLVFEKLY